MSHIWSLVRTFVVYVIPLSLLIPVAQGHGADESRNIGRIADPPVFGFDVPSPGSDGPQSVERELSDGARIYELLKGVAKLVIAAVVILVIGRELLHELLKRGGHRPKKE